MIPPLRLKYFMINQKTNLQYVQNLSRRWRH